MVVIAVVVFVVVCVLYMFVCVVVSRSSFVHASSYFFVFVIFVQKMEECKKHTEQIAKLQEQVL